MANPSSGVACRSGIATVMEWDGGARLLPRALQLAPNASHTVRHPHAAPERKDSHGVFQHPGP